MLMTLYHILIRLFSRSHSVIRLFGYSVIDHSVIRLFGYSVISRSRQGSALLIVLGMLSFMVISAVAFSAYMRYNRLPSSYLRRASASRLLVKAALAEAIDEIDSAIGNNPHPGIGQTAMSYDPDKNSRATGSSRPRNAWKNRIYLGTNNVNNLVSPDDTVSTLTLEGLAYIPPALVNDARYYSRRSRAAQWQNLAFDSGRYAFCAIDVSDFLDVNALSADAARGTSPDNRVTLSYLFESDDHTSASGSGGSPQAWDNFMKNFSGSGKVPLVSLADFNLALFDKSPSGWRSVFCDYVENGNSSFYNGVSPEGAEADKIRRQAFVTSSWFPEGNEDEDHLDLCEETSQPFTESELRGTKSLIAVADQVLANAKTFAKLEKCLDALGFCALYDYLDNNDDPVSLAIPTTERVPMICGVYPNIANATLAVEPTVDGSANGQPQPDGQPAVGSRYNMPLHVTYNVKGLPTAPIEVVLAYPFRHETSAAQNNTYEVGGRMAYFLSVDGNPVGLRTHALNDSLHLGRVALGSANPSSPIDDAIYAVDLAPQSVSPQSDFNGGTQGPQGAVKKYRLTPNGIIPNSIPFLDVSYTDWDTYEADMNGDPTPKSGHSQTTAGQPNFSLVGTPVCRMKPLASNGTVDAMFGANLGQTLAAATATANLKVNLAVWIWVKNKSTGRIVDLAPACVYDDGDLNSRNTDSMSKMWGQMHLGEAYPLLRFDMTANGAASLEFNAANLQGALAVAGGGSQLVVTPQSALVPDPRYNHAPESWMAYAGALTEQTWLDSCGCGWTSSLGGNRDGDIFMSVSDQEKLQSVYELANIPRFTEFYEEGARYGSKNLGYAQPDAGSYANRISFAQNTADLANVNLMWRTYDPFGRYRNGGDDFDGIGLHAGCEGYHVTPFSTQTNVMMAAFANAPHEWRLASDNEQTMTGIPEDSSFNAKYAWNAYSSGAKIDWEDLQDLCGTFMEEMRRDDTVDKLAGEAITWEDVWADLGWVKDFNNGEENSKWLLNDLELADTSNRGRLYNCDRKFLYGYWHDAFALRQQLFLVFVRAEPTLMGGGAVGQTPPSLGARAVALVWRDPTKSTKDIRGPHQTRILFYRQFD